MTTLKPGEHLQQELTRRGWTQRDLATVMGRPESSINRVINGVIGISPRTAIEIGCALDMPPEYWLRLEAYYQLSKITCINIEAIKQRVAEMEPGKQF